MNNGMEKFELARDPAWSAAEYMERREKHDALMRRTAAMTMQGAASLVLVESDLRDRPDRVQTRHWPGARSHRISEKETMSD